MTRARQRALDVDGATRKRTTPTQWCACCHSQNPAACSLLLVALLASPATSAPNSRSVHGSPCSGTPTLLGGALVIGSMLRRCLTITHGQGQMREYLQLATQQYVLNCCLPNKDEPERTEDIQQLHAGLAEMYQHWEVSKEYHAMQSRAMQVLTQFVLGRAPGGDAAVQTVEEPHFTFFDVPGISLVPSLLETVSQQCSNSSAPGITEGNSCEIEHNSSASGRLGAEGQTQRAGSDEATEAHKKALGKCAGILNMFRDSFDDSIKLPASPAAAFERAAAGGGGRFTKAEDALLLNGLKRFGSDNSAWEKIKKHVLPTKGSGEIKARYRKLINRNEESNDVKAWKLSLSEGLSQEEEELLNKGVQYFGTRFDLISEKVIKNRTEEELRKAYAKLISKHARDSNSRPALAASGAGSCAAGGDYSENQSASTGAANGQDAAKGGIWGARGGAQKRRAPAKKKAFNKDLLAGQSPQASKRRRAHMDGLASSRAPLAPAPDEGRDSAPDDNALDDDCEHEVRVCPCVHVCACASVRARACARVRFGTSANSGSRCNAAGLGVFRDLMRWTETGSRDEQR